MNEKKMKVHPHHKGGGMTEFHKGHFEQDKGSIGGVDCKYTEGDPGTVMKESAKKLNDYARSHKAKH